ncbi:hypothetical protein DW155_05670 [Lactococcus petauri]|uniref:DUF4064 domain-containing protein n=2 Tax=Lactococcus petauri TaxID=1940789 RepID=A0A252CFK4_9LACT|nr:hypothetical protein BZZ03_01060 [Lactococcus petauri]RGB59838.1 hypothetical protein DW155_05670 [Lactococcus petauri]
MLTAKKKNKKVKEEEKMENKKMSLINAVMSAFLGSVLIVLSLFGFQLFWNTNPYFNGIHGHVPENWNLQLLLGMFGVTVIISIILIIMGVVDRKSSTEKDTRRAGFYFILGGIFGLFPFLGFVGGILTWIGSGMSVKD